jgi:antitoxin component YwqK of YwqJK toxin-antitoxin module
MSAPLKTLRNLRMPLVAVFSLIFINQSYSQQKVLKQAMFDDLEVTNSITKSYQDSTLTFHLKVLDDQKNPDFSKRYFWFHQGEIKSTVGNYAGKLLHGSYEMYDRNGTLLEKGNFKYGLKEDTWIKWYPNGNINQHVVWKEGKRQGKFEEYFENGSLQKAGAFKNDKLNGFVYEYIQGTEIGKTKYKDGEPVKEKLKKQKDQPSQPFVIPPTDQQGVTTPIAEPKKKKRNKRSDTPVDPQQQPQLQQQQADQAPATEVKKKKEKRKKDKKTAEQVQQQPVQPQP